MTRWLFYDIRGRKLCLSYVNLCLLGIFGTFPYSENGRTLVIKVPVAFTIWPVAKFSPTS